MKFTTKLTRLNEETMGLIDEATIDSASMDLRLYNQHTAYLNAIKVHQRVDRFAAEYSSAVADPNPMEEDLPF